MPWRGLPPGTRVTKLSNVEKRRMVLHIWTGFVSYCGNGWVAERLKALPC